VNLSKSFPDNITLGSSKDTLLTMIETDPTCVYRDWILPEINIPRFSSAVYQKNPEKFFARSAILGPYLGGQEVYNQLEPHECDSWWNALICMMRYASLMNVTGDSLACFEKVAATFMAQNDGVTGETIHKRLFEKLFSDPSLTAQLRDAFASPDSIKNIMGGIGPLFRGLGLDADDSDEDDEGMDVETGEAGDVPDSMDVEDHGLHLVKPSPSAVLRKHKKTTQKKRKQRKSGKSGMMRQLMDLLQTTSLDDNDYQDLHSSVQSSLSGDTTEMGLDLPSMVSMVNSGNMDGLQDMFQGIRTKATDARDRERTDRRAHRAVDYDRQCAEARKAGLHIDTVTCPQDTPDVSDDEESDKILQQTMDMMRSFQEGGLDIGNIQSMMSQFPTMAQ
jgi:hypothetical protein